MSEKPRIEINGEEYKAPEEGDTLEVRDVEENGTVHVTIRNVKGGNISVSGNSILTEQRGDSEEKMEKELKRICLRFQNTTYKKPELLEVLTDYFGDNAPTKVEFIKFYDSYRKEKGWPSWDQLPE